MQAIHVAANPVAMIGRLVDHIPAGLAEPGIAFKEVTVAINVCNDHLLIGKGVAV